MTSYAPGSFGDDSPFVDPMTQQPQGTTPPQNPGGSGTGVAGGVVQPGPQPVVENSPLDTISNYYRYELGRDPDQEGLNFWLNSVQSGQNNMDDVRNAINNSQEGQRFDVSQLYRTALDREPDTEGLNFWSSQMQNGMTLDDILNKGIVPSQEFQDRMKTIQKQGPKKLYEPTGPIVDPYPDGIAIPATSPYETDDFSNPGQSTSNIKDLFGGGGLFGGRGGENKPFQETDEFQQMFNNPFQWVTSQPQYVQNKFEEYLSAFKDPKKALMYTITGGPGAPPSGEEII